jgi:hypothetical protein
MTDVTENPAVEDDDLELFDAAKAEFASKYDLKDRLVLVWATGKNGKRKGENSVYEWFETNTLVIDDPNGATDWNEQVFDSEKETFRDTLVPSVVKNGPHLLEKFQFSYGGMCARLRPRVTADQKPATYKPMLGRVNSRPNAKKGMAPSWSIAEPTDSDMATARKYGAQIKELSAKLKAEIDKSESDEAAFDA